MRASVISILSLLVLMTINGRQLRAEPGPVGTWLMNEPASLWDLGMLRLEEYISEMKETHLQVNYTEDINYDWDENRIMIQFYAKKEEFEKEKCANKINDTRLMGGITEEGKPYVFSNNSIFADVFTHLGYQGKKIPEKYLERLDEIFRIKVHFKNGSCEGKLLSNEVLYSK